MEEIAIIDLFCGIGGLSQGFVKEGFNVIAGFDIDNTCKYAYEINNRAVFISKNISDVTKEDINKLYKDTKIKILVGCAPCQPFSSYSFKNKKEDSGERETEKWKLLYEFSRLIKEVNPDIVSMENVPQLLNFKKAPVFSDFLKILEEMGYFVHYEIVNCPEYGIPQHRKRLVLLASKFGNIKLIDKTHSKDNYVTVRDVIGQLPVIKDGEYNELDRLHYARNLDILNKIELFL